MNKIKKLISDYEKTRDPFVQIGILGQMLIEIKRLSRELHNVNLLQMPEGHDVNSIIIQEGKDWLDERIRKCLGQ